MMGLLVILFPLALLAFMLVMERVESPLRAGVLPEDQVADLLDHARPAEVAVLARSGPRRAIEALRRRRREPAGTGRDPRAEVRSRG